MRTAWNQLLLPFQANQHAAELARDAWFGLAGACHQYAYELAPTAAELRRWHAIVIRLGHELEQLQRDHRADGAISETYAS